MNDPELIALVTQAGSAGLIGWLWVTERRAGADREATDVATDPEDCQAGGRAGSGSRGGHASAGHREPFGQAGARDGGRA